MNIDDIKKIELDILTDVRNFCEANNLKYVLFYGTLLGAIRHKGFIPWDDDIDIAMPRQDYDYFIKNFHSNSLVVTDCFLSKSYFYPFAKVYNSNYPIKEKSRFDCKIGIYIDIFPVDTIAEKKSVKYHKIQRMLHKTWSRAIDLKNVTSASLLRRLYASIFTLSLTRKVSQMMESTVRKYSDEKSSLKTIYIEVQKEKLLRLDSDLFDTQKVEFEGVLFDVPKKYDYYLSLLYGDYMKLPPIEQRVFTHSFEVKVH